MRKIKNTFLSNLLMAAIAMVVIVYFFPHTESSHYKFEEGRPWNYAKLIAPFDIPIKSDSATITKVRDSLDNTFVPVFTRKPAMADTVITALMAKWNSDGSFVSLADSKMRTKAIAFIKKAYADDVMGEEYTDLITNRRLKQVKLLNGNTVVQTPTEGIRSLNALYDDLITALADSSAEIWARKQNLSEILRPNFVYDEETSDRIYNYELSLHTAIKGVIQQGQTIIDKGTIITPQDYTNILTYEQMLEEQLSSELDSWWMVWLGQALYVGILMACLMVYLFFSAPEVWRRQSSMAFIFMMIGIFFLLSTGAEAFIDYGMYFVPFAILPVLMIVFFDAPTALFTTLIMILLCAGTATFPLEFIFTEMAAAMAAVYSLKELSQRSQLLRTSLVVVLSYWAAYVAVEMMVNGSLEGFSWRLMAYFGVAGLLSSIAYIVMVAIEKMFGFVSKVTLIELSDINNPLLRKLSEDCPGTFQHSMAVSTLAADAAIKIGANEQLVRAGALYHDIGKLNNPNFFTENQRGVNPHDALPPERSAQIVIQHVPDGVARADKAGLPDVIKDFIREHHGAGMAKYFYYTYCKAHPGEDVDKAPFTYPGPNPRSRETSVLMMADSVEAASRSLTEHTRESITGLVNKIIDGQLNDGLHNDSLLSFRDVKTIKEEFVKRLMTMYHSRVAYPDAPKKA